MVDETWGDNPSFGVDRALGGGAIGFADPDDLAVLYRDIGLESRLARAVDNTPIPDDQIVRHPLLLQFRPSIRGSYCD